MKKLKEKIEEKLFRAKVKVLDELKNDDGIGVVEVILILLEKTLAGNTYVLCGN